MYLTNYEFCQIQQDQSLKYKKVSNSHLDQLKKISVNIIILFRRISDKKLLINFLSIHSSSSVDLSRGGGGSGLRRSASICDIRPLTETSNVYYATVSFSKYFKTFLRTIFSGRFAPHFLQKMLTFNWCCFESRSIKIIFKF